MAKIPEYEGAISRVPDLHPGTVKKLSPADRTNGATVSSPLHPA